MKKDQKQSEIDSARKITAIVNKLRNSENNFKALNKRYSDSENARTLYNIQQEKEISDLKQNVRSLNKRVAVLEGTIGRLTDENSTLDNSLRNQCLYKYFTFIRETSNRWSDQCKLIFGVIMDQALYTYDFSHRWNKRGQFNTDFIDAIETKNPTLFNEISKTVIGTEELIAITKATGVAFMQCSGKIHALDVGNPFDMEQAKKSLEMTQDLFPNYRDDFYKVIEIMGN